MTTTPRPAWQTPRLTTLRVTVDTAYQTGSGGDLEGFTTLAD